MIAGPPFSVLGRTVPLSLILALATAAAPARPAEPGASRRTCSTEDARNADVAAVRPGSWNELHAVFRRYAACDDGGISEGFSDTVVRLLAADGDGFSRLIALGLEDAGFEEFVRKHVDESVDPAALRRALIRVRQGCPRHAGACEDLEYALEQSGAARGARSSPGFRSVVRAARAVIWSPPLAIDVDGDGLPDTVALGRTEVQAVLAIARAAAPASIDVVRLPAATSPEGRGCGPPSAARLVVEGLPPAGDTDAPPAARTPATAAAKPFRVELGDCDAFHYFFDGKQMTGWRR